MKITSLNINVGACTNVRTKKVIRKEQRKLFIGDAVQANGGRQKYINNGFKRGRR